MITINEYLRQNGFTPPPDDTYDKIAEWTDWYNGFVKSFHSYKAYNGINYVERERKALGMSKTVAEDWASLILNERVNISATGFDDQMAHAFEYNNFRVKGNQLIELAFALGTGAFVEYLDAAGEVVIDYVRADMIRPLRWENGYISDCAFGSYRETADGSRIYLQIHRFDETIGCYVIENKMLDEDSGKEVELPDTIEPMVVTRSEKPLFQIITPNIVNNIDLDSPMGISV